jgi:hypothetical protein
MVSGEPSGEGFRPLGRTICFEYLSNYLLVFLVDRKDSEYSFTVIESFSALNIEFDIRGSAFLVSVGHRLAHTDTWSRTL